MKKTILAALLVASLSATAAPISPVPRVQTGGTVTAFSTAGVTYKLTSGADADADAVRLLTEKLPVSADGTVEIKLGGPQEGKTPSQAEGYYLSVEPGTVTIAGTDGAGQFYGAQSFLQLASGDEVAQTEITDYPEVPIRGIIEGFYGNPWSHEARIDMFEFMGKHKMNEYTYGPKNDPYHRGQWATAYPEAEGKLISELTEAARRNKVNFVWAMHPGNSIGQDQYAAAIAKFEAM